MAGKVKWSFHELENMQYSEFEEIFGDIPSDQESIVSDLDEEEGEDLQILNQIIQPSEGGAMEDKILHRPELIPEEQLFLETEEIFVEQILDNDGFTSEDDLPLSEIRKNLPFDSSKIKWEKANFSSPIESFVNCSGPKNVPGTANSPFDVFTCLFPPELLSHITEQTNLYALQKCKDPLKFKKTTSTEISTFLGINILMGIKRLPALKDYWSSNSEIRDHYISSLMPRNRFMWLLGNLHLNDNDRQPKKGELDYDKLYKLRPFLNKLLETYKHYYDADENQSIDESMIKFKGRSSLRQYMPQKPIKRGYKVWVRANESAYVSEFQIYTGKVNSQEKHLGSRVVKDLTKSIQGNYHRVYFDNFFTSLSLINDLKKSQIYGCGTVRKDRVGLPRDFENDKDMSRGDCDWRMSSEGFVSMKWKDKKGIFFLSNFHNPEDFTSVQRKNKDGTSEEIACPNLVKDYNQQMGHVDKADMLKSLYEIDRKSKRWWLRIFWHFIDVTIVNSFILFRQRTDGRSIELKEFRLAVARGLIGIPKREKRGRPSDEHDVSNRRFKPQVPLETRYSEASHMPIHGTSLRCGFCSTASQPHRTRWHCSQCKIGLCLNDKKNCFLKYHTK